jgi:hypothetical protein
MRCDDGCPLRPLKTVRFTTENRHVRCNQKCPLRANSGHGNQLTQVFHLQELKSRVAAVFDGTCSQLGR